MLDVKLLQNDFATVQTALEKKHVDPALVASLRTLSLNLKEARQALETLQAEQNTKSKAFGMAAKNGGDIEALKEELGLNKTLIAQHTQEVRDLEERL